MWWRAAPGDLARVEDRLATVYVSHARLDRDGNAVTIVRETGVVHLPTAMVAAVLLGPGTTITHAAVSLLADSGTSVLWVGERGVRMYAHGHATNRTARLLLRQAWLVSSPPRRLGVARRIYQMRFPVEDTRSLTMQQLRGREGARVRACYRQHADRTGVAWTGLATSRATPSRTPTTSTACYQPSTRAYTASSTAPWCPLDAALAWFLCHRACARLDSRHRRLVQGRSYDPRCLRGRRRREEERGRRPPRRQGPRRGRTRCCSGLSKPSTSSCWNPSRPCSRKPPTTVRNCGMTPGRR